MHPILFESLIIAGLLVLNGVFAMSEIAVVTSRRARLQARADEGSGGARKALALIDEPTRFLSTVQIGITLIGVLAGAFGGATIAEQLDARFELIPALAPFSEALALGIVVGAISFASLIIGELVPKRIAMQAPERVAAIIAGPMQVVARVASPVVTVLSATTKAILRLLRVSESKGDVVTEDEIRAVIAEGRHSGAVHVAEHEMLEGVFRLGDRSVRDLMIARPDVDWVDVADGAPALRDRLLRANSEAILLCEGDIDDVVGILRPSQLLATCLDSGTTDLRAAATPPLFVPGSLAILRLLDMFKQSGQRVAVVLDEYGGVQGLVSLDDLLTELVGELGGGSGEGEAQIVSRADGTWLVDGATEIEDVFERLHLGPIPVAERGDYRTLAGFILARLGRMPKAAEAFDYGGARFEVIDMDERRVDKVLIIRLPKAIG